MKIAFLGLGKMGAPSSIFCCALATMLRFGTGHRNRSSRLEYLAHVLPPPEHPGATVLLGAKDTKLLREAAKDADVRLGLADYLQEQLNASINAGMGEMDWLVGQYRQAELASRDIR